MELDRYSYQCGAMDAFAEIVGAGVKRLALSHPCGDAAQRDALLPFARQLCGTYGICCQPEDRLLITDLFPAAANMGKPLILLAADEGVLAEYRALKEEKAALLAAGAYRGEARLSIARRFGRLLSYSDEAISRYIARNTDKEP